MTEQPTALRLADALDAHQFDEPHAAAAELRRLNEEVETNGTIIQYHEASIARLTSQRDALLEALKRIMDWDATGLELTEGHLAQARAAIRAVEGK